MEIITVEDWKNYGGLKRPELDGQIPFQIAAANALITQLLGIDDSDEAVDLLPTKPARRRYFMSSPGPNVVNTMLINDNLIAKEQYKVYPDGSIMLKFSPPEGFMELTYTNATFANVPDDLKLAAILLVEFWFKNDYRESRTVGGETIQYNSRKSGVPEHIRTIIEVHRRL